jgi:hypothetical protein
MMVWPFVKKALSRLPSLGAALGEVVFETRPLKGQIDGSLFQWRVKRSMDAEAYFIGLKLQPDSYAGPDGSVVNYINLSIEDAEQAKADLERCIAECRMLSGGDNRLR